MSASDRTVHARTSDGGEVVRYDRAGKWYVEWPGRMRPRRLVTLREAVELAVAGQPLLGQAGGKSFDAKVRKALAAT